jgi:hypothetical protein
MCKRSWRSCPKRVRSSFARCRSRLCARLLRQVKREANDGNAANWKRMSGCAWSNAWEAFPPRRRLCMSESAAQICFRSAEAGLATQTHFLVRAFENRRIHPEEGAHTYLLDSVRAWPQTASRPFQVPGSHGRTARSTVVPPRFEKRSSKEPLVVWAIRVS